jgi:hypothetical protein
LKTLLHLIKANILFLRFCSLKNGVSEPVLQRAVEYWRKIDKEIGDRIAKGVKGQ